MEEIWVPIEGFRRYSISNLGNIWNNVFKRPMMPSRMSTGQLKVSLIDDNEVRRSMSVAVLVAKAFVPAPNWMCTEVILLDGNLLNVAASNLAWRGPRTAYLYARQMRMKQPPWMHNLPVINLETGVIYENIVQCGTTEGVLFSEVWVSINNPVGSKPRVPPFGFTYDIVKRV